MNKGVLFDITNVEPSAFAEAGWIVPIGFGLLTLLTFSATGRQILLFGKGSRSETFIRWFPRIGLLFSLPIACVFSVIHWQEWKSLRGSFEEGECQATRGVVQNLTLTKVGQGEEAYLVTFRVQKTDFKVENWEYLAAWRAPLKSPISNGDMIEIAYCNPGNRIAKIQLL